MKRLLLVILSFILVGCNSVKTRTEVIDTLIDSGYIKNTAGAYERVESELTTRILYYDGDYSDYSESAYRYFNKGPVLIVDRGAGGMNYHFNEDLVYYTLYCQLDDSNTGSTEVVYRFATNELILTHDDCSLETTEEYVNEFYVEASNRKTQALEVINNLGLTIEDLNNLGLD